MIKLKLIEQDQKTKHPNGYLSRYSIEIRNDLNRGIMSIGQLTTYGPSGEKYAKKIQDALNENDVLSYCNHCGENCKPDTDLCADCYRGMTSEF